MNRIDVADLRDPRLQDFTSLTDVALRKSLEAELGLYLAESTKVILRAVSAGHVPRAILAQEGWLDQFSEVIEQFPLTPIFVCESHQLEEITGFHLHRGAIASMHRPAPLSPRALLASSQTVVVLDALSDHTNVGAVFRSAAALGVDAVLLSPSCADPLYRRAVRVSMGAVLDMPWARLPRWQEAGPLMREQGFTIAGFGLTDDAIDLSEFLQELPAKVALVFGAEGPGLTRQAIGASEQIVRIRMDRGVDSLNVGTAAGIAMWAIREAQPLDQ